MRFFCFVSILSAQVFAIFQPLRCNRFGDALNSQQAIGRREWTDKCFPQYRGPIRLHRKIADDTSGKHVEGYPVFAHIDNDGVTSNPANWFAPTDEQADCTIPDGYQLVVFCAE
ncbi:MAG: hypothetical protein JKY15_06395 [Deltaproteobacteria bacterium]|nr:hypothetical protein [Deltaproteobacteria bacterium]